MVHHGPSVADPGVALMMSSRGLLVRGHCAGCLCGVEGAIQGPVPLQAQNQSAGAPDVLQGPGQTGLLDGCLGDGGVMVHRSRGSAHFLPSLPHDDFQAPLCDLEEVVAWTCWTALTLDPGGALA